MSEKTSSLCRFFFGFLIILFIVLKLTHCIDWSWWWVLLPLFLSSIAEASDERMK